MIKLYGLLMIVVCLLSRVAIELLMGNILQEKAKIGLYSGT